MLCQQSACATTSCWYQKSRFVARCVSSHPGPARLLRVGSAAVAAKRSARTRVFGGPVVTLSRSCGPILGWRVLRAARLLWPMERLRPLGLEFPPAGRIAGLAYRFLCTDRGVASTNTHARAHTQAHTLARDGAQRLRRAWDRRADRSALPSRRRCGSGCSWASLLGGGAADAHVQLSACRDAPSLSMLELPAQCHGLFVVHGQAYAGLAGEGAVPSMPVPLLPLAEPRKPSTRRAGTARRGDGGAAFRAYADHRCVRQAGGDRERDVWVRPARALPR